MMEAVRALEEASKSINFNVAQVLQTFLFSGLEKAQEGESLPFIVYPEITPTKICNKKQFIGNIQKLDNTLVVYK